MKINNFRGDLTDISAKKEALPVSTWFDSKNECFSVWTDCCMAGTKTQIEMSHL